MPTPPVLTPSEWLAFQTFVEERLTAGRKESLETTLQIWRQVQEMQTALQEIEALPEAAAGCGFSREEIAAQYRDRLDKLRSH